MSDPLQSPPPPSGIILLPSSRFFVRVLPLVPDSDPARQIELALENRASFPVNQLYYGYLLAPDRSSALVFAAYRKHFGPTGTVDWEGAAAVCPSFLALLGQPPTVPTGRLWTDEKETTVVAWDGAAVLPVAVMARETGAEEDAGQRKALLAEIIERTGLSGVTVQEYSGPIKVSDLPKGEHTITIGAHPAKTLDRAEIETADVRDKEFLAAQKNLQKRDTILWRSFQACAAGLAVMVLWETGLVVARTRLSQLSGQVQSQTANVARIETAQSISRRIEEMTKRRLLPFEMLALVNGVRPTSIQFVRSVTNGLYALEIEAQTPNAADAGQYESALRALPELAAVETRDLRSRDGVTSFVLAITYKPEFLRQEGTP